MNTSHYPSLDLCKKLTEALFPNNTESYEGAFYYEYSNGKNFISNGHPVWLPENPYQQYLCPSVMELLDAIPTELEYEYYFKHKLIEMFIPNGKGRFINFGGTLPNTLAEMWLWLKENKFIS